MNRIRSRARLFFEDEREEDGTGSAGGLTLAPCKDEAEMLLFARIRKVPEV